MRAALRAYVVLDPAPSAVLERMDAFVASHPGSEQLVTVAYGVVSADRRTLTFALAGHPPPLSIHPGGPTRQLGEVTGPALGLGAGPWPQTEVELAPVTSWSSTATVSRPGGTANHPASPLSPASSRPWRRAGSDRGSCAPGSPS